MISQTLRILLLLGASLTALPVAAATGGPAIVEDLTGTVPGLEVFDYVQSGQAFKLPAGAVLTLGYVKSCTREVIQGGTVTIGEAASSVVGGQVRTEQLKCAAGLQLSSAQAGKSGAMVFRNAPGAKKTEAPPAASISSTLPAFTLSQAGQLVLQRLDQAEPPRSFTASGKLLDLARQGVALSAGGTYRASIGATSLVFSVTSDAAPDSAGLVNRLLRL